MSYDYLLYKKSDASLTSAFLAFFFGRTGKMMAMSRSFEGAGIGTVEEVKLRLSVAMPLLQWQRIELPDGFGLPRSGVTDWSWVTKGAPEIALGADDQGQVRLLSVRRAQPKEARVIAKALRLGLLDEQAFG